MQKEVILFVICLLVVVFNSSSAYTELDCVDINHAGLEELQEIKWVGEKTAQYIVDYRKDNEFENLDELDNIYGIGEAKLEDIKEQGIASIDCDVDDSSDEEEDVEMVDKEEGGDDEDDSDEENKQEKKSKDKEVEHIQIQEYEPQNITKSIINLSEYKEIEQDKDDKINWWFWLLVGFIIFIGLLVIYNGRRKGDIDY